MGALESPASELPAPTPTASTSIGEEAAATQAGGAVGVKSRRGKKQAGHKYAEDEGRKVESYDSYVTALRELNATAVPTSSPESEHHVVFLGLPLG